MQARGKARFDSRLVGLKMSPGEEPRPHWLVCDGRLDLRLAYQGMFKSAGLSPVWLATLLRKNPPEVIHAHYGIYGSQLRHLARILSADLVGSFYGYDASMDRYVKSRFWKRRYRRLFDECKAIIVEGPAMGERVMALGCPESKLDVIRLPADNESLAGITRTAADTFLVVAPGWATEKKGFDVAVKAFAQALRGRDARLLLLGGGPLVDELRRLAEALKIADQVEWGGSLDFRSFMTRISAGAVAVFPSRQAQDGNSDGGAPVGNRLSDALRCPRGA